MIKEKLTRVPAVDIFVLVCGEKYYLPSGYHRRQRQIAIRFLYSIHDSTSEENKKHIYMYSYVGISNQK